MQKLIRKLPFEFVNICSKNVGSDAVSIAGKCTAKAKLGSFWFGISAIMVHFTENKLLETRF
jgi:hypothetical protein